MFEQAFKNIADVLWKEAGYTTELDYTEHSAWLATGSDIYSKDYNNILPLKSTCLVSLEQLNAMILWVRICPASTII